MFNGRFVTEASFVPLQGRRNKSSKPEFNCMRRACVPSSKCAFEQVRLLFLSKFRPRKTR